MKIFSSNEASINVCEQYSYELYIDGLDSHYTGSFSSKSFWWESEESPCCSSIFDKYKTIKFFEEKYKN
jgi:hypothetical protein